MKHQHTVLEYIHQIDKVYVRRKCNREREVNSIHGQSALTWFFILSTF